MKKSAEIGAIKKALHLQGLTLWVLGYYFFNVRTNTTRFQMSSCSGIFFLKLGMSSLPSEIL